VYVENLVATLRQVDLFTALDTAELHNLAEHVQLRLYGKGEPLARQGEAGDTFFIIRSGRVRIDVDDIVGDALPAVTVNHLGPGEFFGEMGLLTGAVRGAILAQRLEMNRAVLATRSAADMPADEISRPTLAQRIRSLFGLG
jgi:CRP-like cAMP-binding protein